ncbi:hypothetical protein SCG7086_BH_00080 [Chlamydiales bacterium SCGC AG-110-P3]|nr:hypothetical protein SCG7086_BH_00080 [Chlamydiales bacterium SCGC AG-110-P3]
MKVFRSIFYKLVSVCVLFTITSLVLSAAAIPAGNFTKCTLLEEMDDSTSLEMSITEVASESDSSQLDLDSKPKEYPTEAPTKSEKLTSSKIVSRSGVLNLYKHLGVRYARDCYRQDWYAYYQSQEDRIHLREKGGYASMAEFNHSALHELSHWARADSRLGLVVDGRELIYPFEEVVCDLVATALADEMGLSRMRDCDIAEYVEGQIDGRRMRPRDWQQIHHAVHETVEYLLEKEYPRERMQKYFVALKLLSSRDLSAIA